MKKLFLIGLMCLFLQGCATLAYKQEFTTISALPEIAIKLEPVGHTWETEIINNTDKTIKFLIDESSYVTTDGRVQRLIRGKTIKIHTSSVQPPLPIPPKAKYKDYLIAESSTSLDNLLLLIPAIPTNANATAKFYLVFDINDVKKTWICDVKFIREK